MTVVCAMSANGEYIPRTFLFPRKNMATTLMKGVAEGSTGYAVPSGWMDTEDFRKWLEHFQKHVHPGPAHPVLLILDNHASHRSSSAINYARENFIVMLSLPPHSSRKLQPLDKTFFESVEEAVLQSLSQFHAESETS